VNKKKTKAQYRLRNWSQYNRSLRQRGSLTLWFSEDVRAAWGVQQQQRTGQRGAPRRHSEMAILCMATLAEVYHLPLRATEGFLRSLVKLLDVELRVPDYTTVCRRRRTLEVQLPRLRKTEPLHVVVDASGLKVYGEGEWKVRQHGWRRHRTWRKLHLCVDAATMECVAVAVSTNSFKDSQLLPELLAQVSDDIKQVSADGAYDTRRCYKAIAERGARAVIPPQHNAKIWEHGNLKAEPHQRDENLRAIRQQGRRKWKQESGYHQRSKAETQVFRVKTIFDERVSARSFAGQAAQLLIRCAALNTMTHCGMPDSYRVAA